MFPNPRLKTLNYHKYVDSGIDILKLTSIYGANGAGKSNLIKSIKLLQDLVLKGEVPYEFKNSIYKFHLKEDERQSLVIEFVKDGTAFLYGVEFSNEIIYTEELFVSGLGLKDDKLVFERKTDSEKKTSITFLPEFEKDSKSQSQEHLHTRLKKTRNLSFLPKSL